MQILGARKLKSGDVTGSSDPFVVYSYCGRPVTQTRVKPHTLNPRWHNETFVVPTEEQMAYPRNMVHSQKDLIKFEVFDHDWVSSNDFLGHVELTRSKLMKLAVFSNEKPIRLPLTTKEYHGIVSLQFACDKNYLYIRLIGAEDLDKQDLLTYASPYAKFYLGEKELVATSSVVYNQLHPIWQSGNEFKVKIKSLLETEQLMDAQIRLHKASVGISSNRRERKIVSTVSDQFDQHNALPEFLALLRVELYDRRQWRGDLLLGKAVIHTEYLRSILPDLTTFNEFTMLREQSMHVSHSAAINSRSLSRYFFKGQSAHQNPSNRGDYSNDFTPQASRSTAVWHNIVVACYPLACFSWFGSKHISSHDSDVENSHHDRGIDDNSHVATNPSGHRYDSAAPHIHSPSQSPPESGQNSASMSRGARLQRMLSRRNPKEELVWTANQRFLLHKFSMKSYVDSLGLGQQEDCGYLIVRLLITNHGIVLPGLDEGVRRMTIGETALLKCRYDMVYSNYSLGTKIPPRSNIVFQARLMEINGYGKLGLPIRILRRIFRVFMAVLYIFYVVFASLCCGLEEEEEEEQELGGGNGSDRQASRRHTRTSRRWTRFSLFSKNYNLNLDTDMSSDEEDDDEKEEEDWEEEEEPEEVGGDKDKPQGKVDPYLKKHMTSAVRAGAKLMWDLGKEKEERKMGDEQMWMLKRIQELSIETEHQKKQLRDMEVDAGYSRDQDEKQDNEDEFLQDDEGYGDEEKSNAEESLESGERDDADEE
ncbi:hypothetical protein EON65_18275 [archaeon]|nr:MAG: hypothetical protein EON65_18275 [archaeon]